MGMTIEESCEPTPMSNEEIVETLKAMVFGEQAFERFNAKERETLDKAWNIIDQYENRLKADLVAMLTELQLEIEENQIIAPQDTFYDKKLDGQFNRGIFKASEIIQQKINSLKEDSK